MKWRDSYIYLIFIIIILLYAIIKNLIDKNII